MKNTLISRKGRASKRRSVASFALQARPCLESLEERTLLAVLTVLNTNDSGAGSLRQAILDANAAGGANSIVFNIGSGGAQTIVVDSPLPALGSGITLDGTTQPGFAGTVLIVLSGMNANRGPGLTISGNNNTVRSFDIEDFSMPVIARGFTVQTGTPLTVLGNDNLISGVSASGSPDDVTISGSNNTIGGTTAAARDVFSGVTIPSGSTRPATGNVFEGSSMDSLEIFNGPNTIIGGSTPGAGNVVPFGITISGAAGCIVQGNLICTDATGTLAMSSQGVSLYGSPNCTIGGTTAAARNVIFGGVNVGGPNNPPVDMPVDTNDVIEGNDIGTQIDGVSPLPVMPNAVMLDGILINGNHNSVVGNTIAFSGRYPLPPQVNLFGTGFGAGVEIQSGNDNRISQNVMFDNNTDGIQLGGNYFTPNGTNPGSGPNNSQNFPELTSTAVSGGQTVITGTLNSAPNTTYTLEFFAAADEDPGGFVEGRTFLGALPVTTDAAGNGSFTFSGPANPGPFYTATATDPAGNTSAFWQPDRPTPTISSLSTSSAPAGAGPVSVTVAGTNFFTTSTLSLNGSPLTTTFLSSTQLQATFFGSTMPSPGTLQVTVVNPGPGQGTSNSLPFTLGTPNQRFVANVYQDLLGRQVDPTGLLGWNGLLDQGVSRTQVVSDIESSPEYRTDQVETLYNRYLDRPADPMGLAGGIAFLQGGGTVEQLAAFLIGSPEFYATQGRGSNDEFLTVLYEDALGRVPDSSGRAIFDHALATGYSATAVAAAVLASGEYQQDLVEALYMQFLDRPADPSGLTAFTDLLQQGFRDEIMIAVLAGSTEYLNKVLP